MLTELVEFGRKLDEKMEAMLSEIKENVQGTNRDGKETGTQINSVDTKKKEKMAQRKEQMKTPERIQLSNKEIADLSDAPFKSLVIRMLTELVQYGCKLEEKMKAMLSEIKENIQ